jgi:hypothetical protein
MMVQLNQPIQPNMNYVKDMDSMPAMTNEQVEQMLEEMWLEQSDRLERDWEMKQELRVLTGKW